MCKYTRENLRFDMLEEIRTNPITIELTTDDENKMITIKGLRGDLNVIKCIPYTNNIDKFKTRVAMNRNKFITEITSECINIRQDSCTHSKYPSCFLSEYNYNSCFKTDLFSISIENNDAFKDLKYINIKFYQIPEGKTITINQNECNKSQHYNGVNQITIDMKCNTIIFHINDKLENEKYIF